MNDLVVISLEPWDDVWRRNQHLIAGLLRSDPALRVLFVEPPDDPLHDLRSTRMPHFGHRPTAVPGIARLAAMRSVKWLPRRIDGRADVRLAKRVARAAERGGMKNPVLWINDPRAAPLAALTGWPTLYDITDDWLAAERPAEETERLGRGERDLLARADVVVACSPELVRRKSADRVGSSVQLVRNAVDVCAYRRPAPRPSDLPAGRNAVYVGTIHPDRFDVDLLVTTAQAVENIGTVVLVGPQLLDDSSVSRLRGVGVVLLGSRHRESVIGYLQHADVLLVPHIVDDFTESLDPIKLYEYQAVGRPVVSTPVAGFRDAEDPLIAIVPAPDFAGAVRATMTGPELTVTTQVAVPDWAERVEQMQQILQSLRRPRSTS